MSELNTKISIDAGGNFIAKMRANEQRWKTFSQTGQRQMKLLNRTMAATSRGLDRMGNKYTAILTGAGAVGTGKFLVDLERRFTRIGIAADIDAEKVDKLKQKIFEASRQPDIRIDPGQLTAAIEEIVEKTGDLEFAENNIENLARSISATGAMGKDIGGLAAEFQKMDIKEPAKVAEALDILIVQGKEGAFTLQNLASLGSRVVTAYTSMGAKGVPAIREMGAALQTIRQGTGSSEMAATAFEAMLRTLSDPNKVKMLQDGGIQIFDPEALKAGREELRPINELMEEIVKRVDGKKTLLGQVFDAEAIRAFNTIIGEFNRDGEITQLEKFYQVQADGTTIQKDSQRAANDAAGALDALYTSWQKFADANLTQYIKSIADTLNSVDPETIDKLIKGVAGLALATGGLVLGKKLVNAGKGINDFIRGPGAKKGAGGLMDGLTDGVQPVYVVNMPGGKGGMGGPLGGAKKGGFKPANKLGKWESVTAMRNAKDITKLGVGATALAGSAVLASGAAGYGAGTLAYDHLLEDTTFADVLGRSIAKGLAFFGNDNAKAALDAERKAQAADPQHSKLEIEVTDKRVQVRKIDSRNMDIDVDTGMTVGAL